MANKKSKAFDKLDRRLKGYAEACAIAESRKPGSSKGFRKPGSMNPHKQG